MESVDYYELLGVQQSASIRTGGALFLHVCAQEFMNAKYST